MNLTLKFRDICLGSMNSTLTFIAVCWTNIQLLVKITSAVNKSITFFFKNLDAWALSETFLLPFGQCTILLVDCSLLSCTNFLLFVDWSLQRLNFSLKSLVSWNRCMDCCRQVSDLLISCIDLSSYSLDLLWNLNTLFSFVSILIL